MTSILVNAFWVHAAEARRFRRARAPRALASARLHIQASWAWVSGARRFVASSGSVLNGAAEACLPLLYRV